MPDTASPTIDVDDSTTVSLHQLIYQFADDPTTATEQWILTDVEVKDTETTLELSDTSFDFTRRVLLAEFTEQQYQPAETSDGEPIWGY